MSEIEFNINNEVAVQLTDEGRRIFTAQQAEYPEHYRLRLEEVNGWSRWQLWVLMQTFGPHMSECTQPFATVIRLSKIPVKVLK